MEATLTDHRLNRTVVLANASIMMKEAILNMLLAMMFGLAIITQSACTLMRLATTTHSDAVFHDHNDNLADDSQIEGVGRKYQITHTMNRTMKQNQPESTWR